MKVRRQLREVWQQKRQGSGAPRWRGQASPHQSAWRDWCETERPSQYPDTIQMREGQQGDKAVWMLPDVSAVLVETEERLEEFRCCCRDHTPGLAHPAELHRGPGRLSAVAACGGSSGSGSPRLAHFPGLL